MIEHFTFVLTDGSGQWTFGYTRHHLEHVNRGHPDAEVAFIFLSAIPYAETVFFRALNTCSTMAEWSRSGRAVLQDLYAFTPSIQGQGPPFLFPQPFGTALLSTLDNVCLCFLCVFVSTTVMCCADFIIEV